MMIDFNLFCVWLAELLPLFATLFSLCYGLKHFFKKGKPLFLQTITMAMGSHALSSIYHICLSITGDGLLDGFTPAYLGRIGFFLFILTASYGQMDKIIDDGSAQMKPSRVVALIAPLCAMLLFVHNLLIEDVPAATKISYALVWIPAVFAVYFNLKHAISPNIDFGFIKAIKSYNFFTLFLGFSELICLTAWDYYYSIPLVLSAIVFSILCICTMLAAKRGVEKWTL